MTKKSEKIEAPSVPTEQDMQDARLRLESQVDRQKRLQNEGKKMPVKSVDELRAESDASRNILSIGEAMREVLPRLQAAAGKMKAHADSVREKIAALEPEFCIDHPDIEIPVDEEKTIGKSWLNDRFTVEFGHCPKCHSEKSLAAERAKWLERGVPHKTIDATFDNFATEGNPEKEKVVAKFRTQVKRGKGFIIAVGKWGTGKTHLGTATMKAVDGGVFITMHDLVGELRQSYTDNSGQDTLVNKYRMAKVLVLDEVSIDVFDPDSKKGLDIPPILYRVLGYRHDNDLLTVLTSNDAVEVVMQILGQKLRDRIRESYTIANFTWESHRQPEKV